MVYGEFILSTQHINGAGNLRAIRKFLQLCGALTMNFKLSFHFVFYSPSFFVRSPSKGKPFSLQKTVTVCHIIVSINKYKDFVMKQNRILCTRTEGELTIKSLSLLHDTQLLWPTAEIPLNKTHTRRTHTNRAGKRRWRKEKNPRMEENLFHFNAPNIFFAST